MTGRSHRASAKSLPPAGVARMRARLLTLKETSVTKLRRLLMAGGAAPLAFVLMGATNLASFGAPQAPPAPAPRAHADCGGEPCEAVVRGLLAFFDREPDGLQGNGRSCADCHMATDQFQLSPANAEARFQLLQRRRRCQPASGRSALPANRRRRLPRQWRERQRFHQPAPERPGPDHISPAADHAPDRPGHRRSFDRDRRRRLARRTHRERRGPHGARRTQPVGPVAQSLRRLPAGCPRGHAAGAGDRGVHESCPG